MRRRNAKEILAPGFSKRGIVDASGGEEEKTSSSSNDSTLLSDGQDEDVNGHDNSNVLESIALVLSLVRENGKNTMFDGPAKNLDVERVETSAVDDMCIPGEGTDAYDERKVAFDETENVTIQQRPMHRLKHGVQAFMIVPVIATIALKNQFKSFCKPLSIKRKGKKREDLGGGMMSITNEYDAEFEVSVKEKKFQKFFELESKRRSKALGVGKEKKKLNSSQILQEIASLMLHAVPGLAVPTIARNEIEIASKRKDLKADSKATKTTEDHVLVTTVTHRKKISF